MKTRISQRKPGMSKLAFKKILKKNFNPAKQTLVPVGKYNIKVGKSVSEEKWLKKLEMVFNTKIIREQLVYGPIINENKRQIYVVDGYIPEKRIVLEYLGSAWHGNPRLYNPRAYFKVTKCTYGELYQKTYDRFNYLLRLNYKVFYLWEDEDKKGILGRFYKAGESL